ncbi:MAG TPA: T9SS type A sorting domain-containing protein [Bacteroidales bacterium]|nr:T9SS type A sorting domain-containing protein [Bacteroidales bacterium]
MKRTIFNSALFLLIFILFPVFLFGSPGDGSGKILPSGWEFTPNGSSHIIAVTTTVNFNCVALTDGDYIGVFYTNDQGTLSCGGAFEYATGVNQVLAAYGDDITTIGVKDGFEEGELMTWKVYFSQSGTEQEVLVFYNNLMPNFDGLFMTNGVSALTSMLNPMALQISATPEISCSGESVQLNVMITGGCGTPYFEWSSEPAGFSSNLQNPVVNPVVSTTYTVVVSNQYGDSQTDSVYVEIIPLPEVVCPPAMEACQGDAPVLLDAATPTGGIYTGTGVVFDNGNYYFVPETGIGDFQITYCYIDPVTGCENCCSFIFTVHPLPQVTCPMDMTVCDYSSPFALTGATPEGGNYSGTGVGSGIFDPSIAGAGDHVITYSYTDPDTGCSNSCNFIITVISVEVTCPENLALCLDAEPVILTGGLPDGGVYTGTGVADGIFYPSVAGAGQHTLTYTWTYPGTNCFSSCEFIAEVYPLPEVVCPPAMEACQGDAPVLLDAATPTGGIYTGTGVVFDNGNYYFVPETGIGDFQITYCYIDPVTGCENCCSFIFTVHPLPQVTCPMDMTVCDYSSPFALTGATPEGGNYSGTGVGSGIFDPSIAGAGDHVITYSYTDPDTGCSNSCNFIITVISVEVTCPENLALCLDAEPVILTGGLPDGGVYTGTGVADGIFYPSVAGAGQHTLTYTWTYPGTNCFSSCEFIAEVYPLPQLSCPDDFEVCLNSPDVLLDNAFPVGGVYSGTGVYFENGDYFFEPFIGEGSYVIEYCYTDPATTCSNCCEFTITVAADQIIELPAGWSGISSFLLPDDPELNALLYPITYPLVYLSNFEGVYWPGGNVFTLDTWNVYSGYTIKVEWETQLPVCGAEVQNKIVNLNSGWNLIPVFSSVPVDIESLFGGLNGFQIAKDGAGLGVYWPQFGINTLGVVKPGKAYFVRMTIPGSIDFSSASKIKSAEQISWSALPETPWNKAHITPGSHLIAFTMNETPMLTGDIVGAFDSEGICCGVAEVHDKSLPFVLQAYADDIFENGKTGFETGELLQFQLYRPATGEIFDLNVSYNSALNEGYFEHHGLSEIITAKLSASGMPDFDKPDISFYPNPTSGVLNITGEKSTVNLTVMNALGARVFAGELNLPDKIDLTDQPKGVYLLRVNTHDQVIFKKIVIR